MRVKFMWKINIRGHSGKFCERGGIGHISPTRYHNLVQSCVTSAQEQTDRCE